MADVYKAKDHKLNRFVAVKVLKPEFREDTTFIRKFRSEAQAAAVLTHPNIVNVFDVGDDNGVYYIVMELIEGITLKEYISKKGKLSVKEATSIAIQVSMGLEAAHSHGIVHRDVKPQNIIISMDGKVKVTDFGIARAASSNTISSNVMGSVHYSSPEQVRGGYSDEKSDIYSLGITLYEMVTGKVPFDGDTTVAIAIKHLQEEMVPPSVYTPELPHSLEQIILKCTQKSVDRRYQNMEDVIADLKHSLIDPQGDFVTLTSVDTDAKTVVISDKELGEIKHTPKQTLKPDIETLEKELNETNYDDDDDFEYDNKEESSKGSRKNRDRERSREREERERRIKKQKRGVSVAGSIIALIIGAAVLIAVILVVGKAAGLIGDSKDSSLDQQNQQAQVTQAADEDDGMVPVPDLIGKTEAEAQELIDHFVMKCRMVKFARITSYNELFSGDPTWATLEVGGTGIDGRSMVTKNDYRFLHTLENMGPSPEPNLTVLYSSRLPENFKKFAALISVETSSIQYENDDVMRPVWGDDYSICCCVSATETGKEMQFFGARANLAKCLLYAINGGIDEKNKVQVGPAYRPITSEYLDFDEVMEKYDAMMEWLSKLYVDTLNMIHYMHDKYYYEAAQMSLIDTDVKRSFATGIAGFSHVVDSLCAIKYAKVKAIRDEDGITTDFEIEGDFPRYGNDDDRADDMAIWLLKTFMHKLNKCHTYRNSVPTTSILTITSNVVYGKATGSLPDGRKAGEPLSPGANPSYGAEKSGLLASLNSVAKLPYELALDGISNTQTISPSALGHTDDERKENLAHVMDGYFDQGAHHLNVNVFGTDKLVDAMEHPEKPEYANFTIRVSGYAVKFIDLTREQQLDVIARTCHDHM